MNPLRQLLLKNHWHDKKHIIIEYTHRGVPHNLARFSSDDIKHIGKGFIILKLGDFTEEQLYIPYHRVRKILDGTKTIYENRKA